MRVRLAGLRDRYVGEDGRSVLLVGQLAVVVSPLATVILDQLDAADADGCLSPDLAAALERAFGAPPEGSTGLDLTESTCRNLADTGAVAIS